MKSKMLLCFLSLFMAAAGASANEYGGKNEMCQNRRQH